MLPTIAKISNAVFKSEMVKKLAQKLSVDEDAVKTELRKVKGEAPERRFTAAPAEVKKDLRKAETVVVALLLEGGSYVDRILHVLTLDEFKNSTVRDIVGTIFALHKENKEINPAKLMNLLGSNGEAVALISESVSILDILADRDKALEDCIARIKEDNMKERLAMIQEAIRIAHSQKDEDRVHRLVTEYNNLVKINKV